MREDPSTNAEDKSTNVSISGTPLEHLWNKTIASLGNRYGDLYQISGGPLCHLWNTSRVFLYTGRHPADIPQISFFPFTTSTYVQTISGRRLPDIDYATSGTPLEHLWQRCTRGVTTFSATPQPNIFPNNVPPRSPAPDPPGRPPTTNFGAEDPGHNP